MKNIFLSIGTVALFVLAGCNTGPKMSPIEYNDAIIGEQTKISRVMIDMANSFYSDLNKSETLRQDLVKQCDASIKAVAELPDYKGNKKFRDAGVALFTFYKQISDKEYKEMIDILKKESIEASDLERLTALEKDISAREEALDKDFQDAQQAFAQEHKLTLRENEIQGEIDNMSK